MEPRSALARISDPQLGVDELDHAQWRRHAVSSEGWRLASSKPPRSLVMSVDQRVAEFAIWGKGRRAFGVNIAIGTNRRSLIAVTVVPQASARHCWLHLWFHPPLSPILK